MDQMLDLAGSYDAQGGAAGSSLNMVSASKLEAARSRIEVLVDEKADLEYDLEVAQRQVELIKEQVGGWQRGRVYVELAVDAALHCLTLMHEPLQGERCAAVCAQVSLEMRLASYRWKDWLEPAFRLSYLYASHSVLGSARSESSCQYSPSIDCWVLPRAAAAM